MTDEEQEKVTYTRPKDEGEVDSRRLAAVIGAAGTVATIALISMFSIGMVGAALGVGIGGFVANFDNVSYNASDAGQPADAGAAIYPVLGSQPACENAPQITASLTGTSNLYGGVEFFKDLPLPSDFTNDDFARISIVASAPDTASGIEVSDLNLRLSALETKSLNLTGADIGENSYQNSSNNDLVDNSLASDAYGNGTGASGAEFAITADSFNLPNGGSAAAHQVSFQSISLQDLDLFVQILNSSDTNDLNGTPDRFVSASGDRNCDALASASKSSDANDLGTVDTNGTTLAP
jgi:hypothetical protein